MEHNRHSQDTHTQRACAYTMLPDTHTRSYAHMQGHTHTHSTVAHRQRLLLLVVRTHTGKHTLLAHCSRMPSSGAHTPLTCRRTQAHTRTCALTHWLWFVLTPLSCVRLVGTSSTLVFHIPESNWNLPNSKHRWPGKVTLFA